MILRVIQIYITTSPLLIDPIQSVFSMLQEKEDIMAKLANNFPICYYVVIVRTIVLFNPVVIVRTIVLFNPVVIVRTIVLFNPVVIVRTIVLFNPVVIVRTIVLFNPVVISQLPTTIMFPSESVIETTSPLLIDIHTLHHCFHFLKVLFPIQSVFDAGHEMRNHNQSVLDIEQEKEDIMAKLANNFPICYYVVIVRTIVLFNLVVIVRTIVLFNPVVIVRTIVLFNPVVIVRTIVLFNPVVIVRTIDDTSHHYLANLFRSQLPTTIMFPSECLVHHSKM
ncbi:hypothetical protein ACJX0J_031687 [Zea mays]